MKLALRLIALTLMVVTLALWFFGGTNLGWTKTTVMVEGIDPVTDQRTVNWERRFLPGLEFLAGGLVAAGVLAGGSFFVRGRVAQRK